MKKSIEKAHVIVGLGLTGVSCARYLIEKGMSIAINDTRVQPPNLDAFKNTYPDVHLSLGGFDETLLLQAERIILSPGVSLHEPIIQKALSQGIPVIGDIELFAENVKHPVIAITGTNAKSTVTTLVGKMAQRAGFRVGVGGNLGLPALDLLQDLNTNLYVLECSSFQLETTYSLKTQVATILNITPDHMDRYRTFHEYQQAKHRIYQHCQKAVINRDDALTYCHEAKQQLFFTLDQPKINEFGLLKKDHDVYLAYEDQALISTLLLPIKGKHYQANALASLAIGYSAGFSFSVMLDVLREFKGLPHRCQLVRERHGVTWYNDSKGTNVGATQAAIAGLGSEIQGKLILIAGGLGKNADFTPLVPLIKTYSRHVVLIGEAAIELARVIDQTVSVSFANSMEEAVQQADKVSLSKDSVLLSPACASYDMFKHFEHRGQVFTDIVLKLE